MGVFDEKPVLFALLATQKITNTAGIAMSKICNPILLVVRRLPSWAACTSLTVGAFLLTACGGGGGSAPPPPLTLTATSASLGAGTTLPLTAAGGQTPYTFSVASGGGSIDGSGLFTAPETPGTAVAQVADKNGMTARVSLQIVVVAFLNAAATVDSATITTQAAAGGAPPYAYSVASGGGSIDATGKFTSPAGPAAVTLLATDSKGATAQASITVNAPLAANQPTATIGGGTTLVVAASGGQGPFSYAVTSGAGTVDSSGHFVAPTNAGISVVTITDALGVSTTVSITVNPPLAIIPASATVTASSGQTMPFIGANGVPPYSYALVSGAGNVNAQGVYTVGTVSGLSTVQVTDSQGTRAMAKVSALRIRVNSAVFATATDGTSLYVGGRFSAVNPYSAPRLAIVDQTSGNPLTTCDLGTGFLTGSVTATVTVGNSIYVAGSFSQYHGASVGKVAKIDATSCALDPIFVGGGGFGANPGESVYALAVSGSSLYVAGNVSTYRGAAVPGLAKIDLSTGAPDSAFAPGTRADGNIAAILLSGNSLYLAGYFQHINGATAPNLAKLDAASGAIDTNFTAPAGADGPITVLATSGNQLYVGGSFTHYAGVQTALARVSATSGALDTSFTQSVANVSQVSALLVLGNSLYVGREFPGAVLQKIDTVTGIADANFSSGTGFDFGVNALLAANSSLYVGGAFTNYRGAPAYSLAKIDPTSGVLDATFTQSTGGNNSVYSLASAGSRIIAGGTFSTYRGTPANNIAKFSVATDEPNLAFNAAASTNSNVIALKLNGAAVYIGGVFSTCGGVNSFLVAKIDTVTGICDPVFAAGGGAPFLVNALLIHGNSLYLGGGTSTANLAKMDLQTGHTDAAFLANGITDGTVLSLADSPTSIYVAGQFQNFGGKPARNLAKIDPASGALDLTFTQSTGAGGPDEYVWSLLMANGSLYAGGVINSYRGTTAQGLLKVDPVTGSLDTTFSRSTGYIGNVEALLSVGSSIVVAGSFQSYRGAPSFNLAKIDSSTGAPDGTFTSNLSCDSCDENFDTLTLLGTKLYVGGDFPTLYRGEPTYGVFPVDISSGNPTDP
jgi:hypothetical protein